MSFTFYAQHDQSDCGPACLRMVARAYGLQVSQAQLKQTAAMTASGLNLAGLTTLAGQLGFETHPAKLSVADLEQHLPLPAILHWNQQHYVVLYRISKGNFFIADPASGKTKLSRDNFLKHWLNDDGAQTEAGIALLMEPGDNFSKGKYTTGEAEPVAAEKKISGYLRKYKAPVAGMIVLTALLAALQLLPPYLTRSIVDKAIGRGDYNMLVLLLAAQCCLVLGRISGEYIRTRALAMLSSKINISILSDLVAKLLRLPISYFSIHTKGGILQRMQDHSRIEAFLTGAVLTIVFAVFSLLFFAAALAWSSVTIFLIFLGSAILYATWVLYFMSKRKKLDYERFHITVQENNTTLQLLEGAQEIRLFGIEDAIREKWDEVQQKNYDMNMRITRLDQWQRTGGTLINESRNLAIIFILAGMVMSGSLSLGTMMAIQLIIGQLGGPVEQVITFSQNWQHALISMERINAIHQVPDEGEGEHKWSDDHTSTANEERKGAQKGIVLNNVSFAYPGDNDEPVLHHISCSILPGKTTAVVGASGSGKTTLFKLLLKYYPAAEGHISVNGIDLDNYLHKPWRSRCGVVMQDSYIFPDTVLRNIVPGNAVVNQERLREAIRIARVEDVISRLPQGIHTKIGEEGHGISSGQKQRILIARVVYKDPEFIFLDEATNNLDALNEKMIHEELKEYFRNKTVVIVAHRLSTIRSADQILVMQKGNICESGEHDQLIQAGGVYFSLVQQQLSAGEQEHALIS